LVDYKHKEIVIYIVYYGPALAGKLTNVKLMRPDEQVSLESIGWSGERARVLDFVPHSMPRIRGYSVRMLLLTTPSALFVSRLRRKVLRYADGVIFVADSQRGRREANLMSMVDLQRNLETLGIEVTRIPLCLQYNKRDLPNAVSLEELRADLNPDGVFPEFEAMATEPGAPGAFDTLKCCVRMILKDLGRAA